MHMTHAMIKLVLSCIIVLFRIAFRVSHPHSTSSVASTLHFDSQAYGVRGKPFTHHSHCHLRHKLLIDVLEDNLPSVCGTSHFEAQASILPDPHFLDPVALHRHVGVDLQGLPSHRLTCLRLAWPSHGALRSRESTARPLYTLGRCDLVRSQGCSRTFQHTLLFGVIPRLALLPLRFLW